MSQILNFDLYDEGCGSSVSGTLIVIEDGEDVAVTVLASFVISEEDYGGLFIYFCDEFEADSILCTYQDDLTQTYTTNVWIYTDSAKGVGGYVNVGTLGYDHGGGTGFIEANFTYVGDGDGAECEFKIGIGTGEFEGYTSITTTITTISFEV